MEFLLTPYLKGLLINSPPGLGKSLCESRSYATARLSARNGKAITLHPELKPTSCKARRSHKRQRH